MKLNPKTRDTLAAIVALTLMLVIIGLLGQCMGPDDLGVASPN